MTPFVRRLLWTAVLLAAAGSFWVPLGFARQTLVVGSEEGGWVYRYLQPVSPRTLAFAGIAIAVSVTLLVRGERAPGRPWAQLATWWVAALLLQALLRTLTPFTMEQMFVSTGANSFYDVTRHYFPATVLRDFNELRATWPLHAQSNMPGKLMLVYALRRVSREPLVLAWLVVAISNLGAVLTYWFTRDLIGDSRAALWAAVLYLFVPAKLYFFPLLNTVTPVAVLLAACLLQRWLQGGRVVFAGLFGVALYGLAFFEPLPLVLGLLFAALIARALHEGQITGRQILWQGAAGVVTFAATYVLVRARTGFDLASAFSGIAAHATEFNEKVDRPYGVWARQNLVEFVVGAGVGAALLTVLAAADGAIAPAARRWGSPVAVLSAALIVTLLVTDLIGINRGEVVRLWIFLACFVQIPAAYWCARLQSVTAMALLVSAAILQGALGTAMIGFILP